VLLSKEHLKPESFYNPQLAPIIELLSGHDLIEISNGAKCVFLDGYENRDGQPLPIIVQKTDGGFLYTTTDLAAIHYRSVVLNATRLIYVVDARQALHFEQLFTLAKKAELVADNCSMEHIAFGTMMDSKPEMAVPLNSMNYWMRPLVGLQP